MEIRINAIEPELIKRFPNTLQNQEEPNKSNEEKDEENICNFPHWIKITMN